MEKNLIKALTDGVIAIIIFITVFNLKEFASKNLNDFKELSPVLFVYVFSFMFIAIFWVNHHFLFKRTKVVNLKSFWCNIAWLSAMFLIPFTTSRVCSHPNSYTTLSVYFLNITLAYIAYQVTYILITRENGDEIKHRTRSIVCLVAYLCAAMFGGFYPLAAFAVVAIVSCPWVFIEKKKRDK